MMQAMASAGSAPDAALLAEPALKTSPPSTAIAALTTTPQTTAPRPTSLGTTSLVARTDASVTTATEPRG